MQELTINMWAVLAAAVVRFAIGGIWYSPPLFARQWVKLSKLPANTMKKGAGKGFLVELVGGFLMAYVLVHAIKYAGVFDPAMGMMVGFWNWLGFIAVVQLSSTVFEKKPFKLFLITGGYQLVSLLAMGAILAKWG